MFFYALKRMAYSVLVILGVLLLTFLLFRVAAGDPAATVLGKNPSPREIEDMRRSLGVDKPLLWGSWRRTELYSSADFKAGRTEIPGVSISGEFKGTDAGLRLEPGSKLSFARNFQEQGVRLKARISCDGALLVDGVERAPEKGLLEFEPDASKGELTLSPAKGAATVSKASFERAQENPLDSQMLSSVRELADFKGSFPYISLLNFGDTLLTREPIREILWRGIWPSLALMLPIFIGEMVIGMALALLACAFRGGWPDKAILLLSVAGMSVSYIALIIFGQWLLGYCLKLFPIWGWGDPRTLALPVIIGVVSGVGGGVRFYRSVFLNEMNKEYLRTAVAKGCSPLTVYCKHLLKNAMIPIMTRASTALPFLFTGSLLLESFFGIPGLGYAGINAVNNADIQTLKALVMVGAFLFVGINLLTDLAYAWADPRIRLGR